MVMCYVGLIRQKKSILTGFGSRAQLRILPCCCAGAEWRHDASHSEARQIKHIQVFIKLHT